MEPLSYEASDGALVHLYRWLPEGPVRGSILIAHGMGEHAGRYDATAQALRHAGFAVYANDHRGHGRTAPAGQLGNLGSDGWNRMLLDSAELLDWIRAAHPEVPQVLFGHSMGAMLTQQFLTRYGDRLDAVILSGSPGRAGLLQGWLSRGIARFERWRLGADAHSALLQQLLFGRSNKPFDAPGGTGYEWLSRDAAEVRAYAADPWCGFVLCAGSLCDLFAGDREAFRRDALARIPPALPLYVFSGSDDPVHAGERNLQRLLEDYRARLNRLEYRLYPGGRHEMLNETNRGQVLQDLLGWLNATLPVSPPDGSAAPR